MRSVRYSHHAGPIAALEPLDFAGDQIEGLLPGDAHISGFAAVARIALAVRIEVDALHRVKQPIGGIDDGFGVLAVRGERGLARRRECEAARTDGPWRWIIVAEI